jgi:hypothetical protein
MTRGLRGGAMVLALAPALTLSGACKGGGKGAPAPAATSAPAPASGPAAAAPAAAPAGPAVHPDTVIEAFTDAGLSPEGFAVLDPVPYGATVCKEGRVQTIDTLVCEYRDAPTLARGETALLEHWGREGGHTGLALHNKLTLLGVFDRARHDPNGKVISKVIATFKKL